MESFSAIPVSYRVETESLSPFQPPAGVILSYFGYSAKYQWRIQPLSAIPALVLRVQKESSQSQPFRHFTE